MNRSLIALLTVLALIAGCDNHDHSGEGTDVDDHGHSHEAGPHGGPILDLGSGGHLEVVHDDEAGSVKLYLLGGDMKSPVAIADTPVMKLTTPTGQKVLTLNAEGELPADTFSLTHDALKTGELMGRITIKIEGKTYNPDLEAAHKH